MAVEHKFLKNLVTSPTPGNLTDPATVTVVIDTTLVTPADLESVAVSFNGQNIRKHNAEVTQTFSKYYYEVVNNNAAFVATPVVGIENQCSITFTIHANTDFMAQGYTTGIHQAASFSDTDVFYISFYHTVIRDV